MLFRSTFSGASVMNADLTGWKVGKVVSLVSTFNGAAKFTGTGVDTWNVTEAKSMSGTFTATTSLTTCNKRKIADAWKSSTVFVATTYDTDWAADTCLVCVKGKFLETSSTGQWCGECEPGTYTATNNQPSCVGIACAAGKYGPASQTTSSMPSSLTGWCGDCGAGTFTVLTGQSVCSTKATTSCTSGKGYNEGTTSANDASCANCAAAKYSNTDDALPCKPHSTPSCPAGQGVSAGTTSADASCASCENGKYSVTADSSPCTDNSCAAGKYLSSAADQAQTCSSTCVPGKYKDGGCIDCKPGTYQTGINQLSCSGSECAAGTFGPAAQSSLSSCVTQLSECSAPCAACSKGRYAAIQGQTTCKLHSTAECGAGLGYTAGSPTADDASCETCKLGHTYNTGTNTDSCIPVTVASCPAGESFTNATLSADAYCSFGPYFIRDAAGAAAGHGADLGGTKCLNGSPDRDFKFTFTTVGACANKCAKSRTCLFFLIADEGYPATRNRSCIGCTVAPTNNFSFYRYNGSTTYQMGIPNTASTTSPSPSSVPASLKKEMDAAQAAADNLNKNNGSTTTAEATLQRTQLINMIGTLVSASGATAGDLATASAEEKQQVIGVAVEALSSAVTNASQLGGPRGGSEIALVLSNMTDLADSIGVTFDAKMTGQIVDTISAVLDVRGATPPDAAIDMIDQVIRTIAANNHAEVITAKSDRVALMSTTSSQSPLLSQGSGWLSAFGGGEIVEAVEWQDEVDQMTEPGALLALDQPVQVQVHLGGTEAAGGGDTAAATAGAATTTTLAQFSGGRNPYWPSPYSSSDIVSLSISVSSRWKQRQSPVSQNEGSGRRRLGHRRSLDVDEGDSGKINVTFETSTPLWTWWGDNRSAINGTASTPPEGAVAYQTEDVCGNKVTHKAKTARFSATDNAQVWWVWCAWWNKEDRGWHTEGCTIADLSMKEGSLGDLAARGSRSGTRREAVVLCECLMDRPINNTAAFTGSFGIIKEDTEEDQFKRLEDKKGDAGTLIGYVFNRIGESFNINLTPFEVIPSAMYLCFVPLAVYLLALVHLQLRASFRWYPGYTEYHRRQDSSSSHRTSTSSERAHSTFSSTKNSRLHRTSTEKVRTTQPRRWVGRWCGVAGG